ncbi:MAG: Siderophore-interacting protein [Frankiales bacterium]|nr:Siderophore-interacting protein [Frankiales bacterium]
MPDVQRIARTAQFRATVAQIDALSPRMRRLTLRAPELAEHDWPLACDIAVVLAAEDGREVRRRYTVRSLDSAGLVLDAVLHGHGPGSAWAAAVTVGEPVTFFGPRGEVPAPEAGWYLALTDEAGLPAVAAASEAVLARTPTASFRVLAEVHDAAEVYPLPPGVRVDWLSRGERPAGGVEVLNAGLAELARATDRPGYAYVLGESRAVVTLRDALAQFGLDREHVYAKGYWNLNARAGR